MKRIGLILILLLSNWATLSAQDANILWLKKGHISRVPYSLPKISTKVGHPGFYLYDAIDTLFIWQGFQRGLLPNGNNYFKDDGFTAKMDDTGNLIWFSQFGVVDESGGRPDLVGSSAVGLDIQNFDQPVITGYYYATSLFDSDTLQSVRNGLLMASFFTAQYTPQGRFTKLHKESPNSIGTSIVRDNHNNTYTALCYYDTAWVNRQMLPIVTNTGQDAGMCIIKYNANNQVRWKIPIMASYGGWNFQMQLGKQNDLYFGSQLGRPVDTGIPNPVWKIGTRTIPNTEINVGYVAKADSNGNVKWVKTITGPGDASVNYLVLDANEIVYATGYYTQSATFAPGVTLTATGAEDIFLAKYDKNGNVLWAKSMGGTGSDFGWCLAIDETTNSLYMSGDFENTATFAPGKTVTSAGENDVFFAWFDLNGTLQKVIRMGGTSYDTRGWCTVPASSQLLVSGNFSNTADFLGTTLQADAPPDFQGRKQNFFIAKLKWEGPLALESLKLTALPCLKEQARLQWQSVGSFAPCTFYVERSTDGHIWKDIHSACLNEGQQDGTFDYTDPNPPFGKVFYRIRYDSENDFRYSNIVQTQCNTKVEATEVEVYPNPVSDKIYVKNPSAVRWFNSSGQEIFLPADPDGGCRTDHLPAGIYFVQTQGHCFKWIKW